MAEAGFTPFPTVEPTGAPGNDYERVNVSGDMFGAQVGAAKEKLGAALESGGQTLVSAAIQQLDLQNQVSTADATGRAVTQLDNLFGNYSQLNGQNALGDAHTQYQDAVNKTIDDAIAQASNPKQKAELAQVLRRYGPMYLRYGQEHNLQQFKYYNTETMKMTSGAFGDTAILAFTKNDPAGFDEAMNNSAGVVGNYALQQGLGQQAADELAKAQRGDLVAQAVKSAIDDGDVAKAQAVFNKYQDRIDAKNNVAIQTMLKTPARDAEVQGAVSNLMHPMATSDQLAPKEGQGPAPAPAAPPSPQSFIPKVPAGAGEDIVRASLSGDSKAIAAAYTLPNLMKDNAQGKGVQDYLTKLPLDVQLAMARQFRDHPELWKSVPESIFGHDIRGPAQAASAKLLQEHPDVTPAKAVAQPGAPVQVPGRGGGGASGRQISGSGLTGLIGDLTHFESGQSNIANTHQMTSSGQAQGYFQITTGTWKEFGGLQTGYSRALDAPYAVQASIAAKIPLRRWAPETIAYLEKKGYHLDLNKTLAENAAMNGGGMAGTPSGRQTIPADYAMRPKEAVIGDAVRLYGNRHDILPYIITAINQQYTMFNDLNKSKIDEISQNVPPMIKAIEDGNIDPEDPKMQINWNDVYNYVPDKAQQWHNEWEAAKYIGMLVNDSKWASVEDVAKTQAMIASGQGPIFDAAAEQARRSGDSTMQFRLAQMADHALERKLADRETKINGPDSSRDPAALVRTHPMVAQLFNATKQDDPASYTKYAQAALSLEQSIGTAPEHLSVLTRDQARNVSRDIQSNVLDAKNKLDTLHKQVGDFAWPYVYRDIALAGKLPPAYQALANLPKEDARTFAQALQYTLQEPTKGWEERLGQGNKIEGSKTKQSMDSQVDLLMKPYAASLYQSGISTDDIESVNQQVKLLAYGNTAFKGDSNGVANAVKSFIGNYDYMPLGGARIPVLDQMGNPLAPTIKQNAATLREAISASNIQIPEQVGKPGQPDVDKWIGWVKSGAEWVTAPTGDKILLREPGGFGVGKYIRGLNGQPIAIPFRSNHPFENFEIPQQPMPIPPSGQTRPGGEGTPDDGFTPAQRAAMQIYENSLLQSGHFTPDEVEKMVTEYKKNFVPRRAVSPLGADRVPPVVNPVLPPAGKTPEATLGTRG